MLYSEEKFDISFLANIVVTILPVIKDLVRMMEAGRRKLLSQKL